MHGTQSQVGSRCGPNLPLPCAHPATADSAMVADVMGGSGKALVQFQLICRQISKNYGGLWQPGQGHFFTD